MYEHYARLMDELRAENPQSFYNYLRMEPGMFDELVQRVWPRIEKILTRMRSEYVECCWNAVRIIEYLESSQSAVRIYFQCRSIFLHFESSPKVLNMFKTFLLVTKMCRNILNHTERSQDF